VPELHGIPPEFFIFGLTLLGVAVLHRHALPIAASGLLAIIAFKLAFTGFEAGGGVSGLAVHFAHEWVTLANLLFLLVGFALLARHFEDSGIPAVLPRYLPDGWSGGLVLLSMVFVMSSFLDNIAAALIGGAMAHTLFRGRVHIGYLAAIVAAANAGGAGSVIGDTTTTMMWIRGVAPSEVFHAYVAAIVALMIFGVPAALQQHRWSPITKDAPADARVDWARLIVVAVVLACAVTVNVLVNTRLPQFADRFPFIGVTVGASMLATLPVRRPDWSVVPAASKGALFLLSLVASASLMPVEALPNPSWQSAFGLGFVSAVFDNIPLTALALKQGGFDWGFVAYAVGFGGSMIWFGSSAGVALSSLFPEARSTGRWLREGWHVALGYVLGYFALLVMLGWHPHAPN
jgi:Na+/H+ antiporter NhaD/arsenite permease-like protein